MEGDWLRLARGMTYLVVLSKSAAASAHQLGADELRVMALVVTWTPSHPSCSPTPPRPFIPASPWHEKKEVCVRVLVVVVKFVVLENIVSRYRGKKTNRFIVVVSC